MGLLKPDIDLLFCSSFSLWSTAWTNLCVRAKLFCQLFPGMLIFQKHLAQSWVGGVAAGFISTCVIKGAPQSRGNNVITLPWILEKFSHAWRMRLNTQCFSPGAIGHLMGAVEHPHQHFLVIDARQHNDHRGVDGDQIQVVFGEVEVDGLKSKWATPLSGPKTASICVPTIMEPEQQKLFHFFVPPPLNLTFSFPPLKVLWWWWN